MFGHDDQKDQDDDVTTINPSVSADDSATPTEDPTVATDSTAASTDDSTDAPASDFSSDSVDNSDVNVVSTDSTLDASTDDTPESVTDTVEDTTEAVTTDFGGSPEVVTATEEETTVTAPAPSEDVLPEVTTVDDTTTIGTPSFTSGGDDHDTLLELKKTALEELAPLVDQLDQTPEEKFKTTMMMIQATDASDLVKAAHDAAKEITDEKARAQALLDIVNEINYFTQKDTSK